MNPKSSVTTTLWNTATLQSIIKNVFTQPENCITCSYLSKELISSKFRNQDDEWDFIYNAASRFKYHHRYSFFPSRARHFFCVSVWMVYHPGSSIFCFCFFIFVSLQRLAENARLSCLIGYYILPVADWGKETKLRLQKALSA